MSDQEDGGATGSAEQTGEKRGRGRPRKPKPDQVIYVISIFTIFPRLKVTRSITFPN
jgi:hypothetical protein